MQNLCFSLLRDITAVPREIENNAYEKFRGANKVHYGSGKGGGGGGGFTPIYKPHRYVPPHWVGFLCRFDLKTGIHFAHFGLESGMVFEEGTMECMNVFIVSNPNE